MVVSIAITIACSRAYNDVMIFGIEGRIKFRLIWSRTVASKAQANYIGAVIYTPKDTIGIVSNAIASSVSIDWDDRNGSDT